MRLIWITVILLIAYGSLYPFNFDLSRSLPADLLQWLGNWEQRTIRSDLIANILLFIPFGFFGVLTIQQDGRRSPILSTLWMLLLGVGFALFLQFLQFFLPSRVPHAADALVNSIGILLGISMAAYTNSHRVRRLLPQKLQFNLTPALLILALWIGWSFFPYTPVFDGEQLGKGLEKVYKSQWQWSSWLKYSIFWLVFFYSFSRVMARNYHLGVLVALALFILAIKLSIFRSQLGWSELTAVPLALVLHHLLAERWQIVILAFGSKWLLLWKLLTPWQWLSANSPINSIEWLPFKDFLGGSTWLHLTNLLEFSLVIACLGYALARWFKSFRVSLMIMLVLILIISGLQLYLVGKTPNSTNLIMVLIIGFLLERIDRMR